MGRLRRKHRGPDVHEQLRAAQLSLAMTEARLRHLMSSDKYRAGFDDAVTVTLNQVSKWLADSREKAGGIIADLGDHANRDWKRGHDFAAEWIDRAIADLITEVAIRVAQEEAR